VVRPEEIQLAPRAAMRMVSPPITSDYRRFSAPSPAEAPEPEPRTLSGCPVLPFVFEDADLQFDMRIIDRDGNPWWVIADICAALDIGNPSDAASRLDADEKGIVQIDTLGGRQAVLACNEPGMWKLVLRSDKPRAKALIRFLTHDVLPQIRKTGRYESDGPKVYRSLDDLKADPDALLSLAMSQAGEVKRLSGQVAEMAPKAAALDRFADRKGLVTLTQAAKALGLGRNWFCRELRRMHYLYYTGPYDDLVAYEKYVKAGWFVHKPVVIRDDRRSRFRHRGR
jgi:anti-repressor protein